MRSGSEIVELTIRHVGVKNATAHNARKELENEGKICSPKYGFYKLKEDCTVCKHKETCGMTGNEF